MTREEFDAKHKVNREVTEGYSQQQIDWINDYIWNKVKDYPVDHEHIRDHVQNMFPRAEIALEHLERKHG